MSNGYSGIRRWSVYIILVVVLTGCSDHSLQVQSPHQVENLTQVQGQDTPQSPELTFRPVCSFKKDEPSCFYQEGSSKTQRSKLIIFVHGVTSSAARTWGDVNAANSWPTLLNGDNRFTDYDLYFMNYLTSEIIPASQIHEIADNQLGKLRDFGIFKQYKDIYFVAHSMGGLVVKSLLVNLNHGNQLVLLRQVKAVIFLGTPALGANLAGMRGWFSFNPQFTNMERLHKNPWLSQLEGRWFDLMNDRKGYLYPKAYCGYETLPIFPWGIIVPEEMTHSTCDEKPFPFQLNHSDLAVPTITGDDPYLWVMGRIDETSTGLKTQTTNAKQYPTIQSDVLSLYEIRAEVKGAVREVIAESGIRPPPPAPNLPEKEVARELTVRKELTSLFERVGKEYAEGNSYYKEEKFDTAINHFKNAIDLVPRIPSLYLALGNSYSASARYNDAIATYERGLRMAKQSENVYVDILAHRGSAKEGLGYHQEAIDDLSLAITLNQNYAYAYSSRGVVKSRLNDFQGAIADYTAAIKLNPDNADVYYNRSVAKSWLNDFPGAIADSTEAITLSPDDADAYYHRGAVKNRLNDFPGVIADSTVAITLNPKDARAYRSRGVAKILLNDFKGAIGDYTETITLNPDDADAYYNRGLAKGYMKDFQGAIDDYTDSITLSPDHADAYHARGEVKSWQEDFSGAIVDYTEAIDRNPDYTDAYYNRCLAKYWLKNFSGAIADCTETINRRPSLEMLVMTYWVRGFAHTGLGNEKEATDDFKRARE